MVKYVFTLFKITRSQSLIFSWVALGAVTETRFLFLIYIFTNIVVLDLLDISETCNLKEATSYNFSVLIEKF